MHLEMSPAKCSPFCSIPWLYTYTKNDKIGDKSMLNETNLQKGISMINPGQGNRAKQRIKQCRLPSW